jgi:hypothetical protein
MTQKLTKLVEFVFDVTLNTVKSLLWMLIVTILCILTILTGFFVAIAQIAS